MTDRSRLSRSIMERAAHIRVKVGQIDNWETLAPADQARAPENGRTLRAQARNLITIAREQLTALEALCRD
jgi:hypothetical protein